MAGWTVFVEDGVIFDAVAVQHAFRMGCSLDSDGEKKEASLALRVGIRAD
jgi:hypothetical protein